MAEISSMAHTALVALSHRARTLAGVEDYMRYVMFAGAMVVALSMPLAARSAQSLEAQLQKAIQTETVTGDLKAAIEQYRRIVQTAGAGNRRIAAQALVRMADAHRKLGDAEASKIYERIIREYADQPEAAEARTGLASMRVPPAPRGPASQTARQIWAGPDADYMGAPSLDGRVLSYTDWETGDLGLRDLVTGQNRRLTNTGGWEKSGDYAESSLPSPDGSLVAYAWFSSKPPDHRKKNYYDLRLIASGNGDAAKSRLLYEGEDSWLSPAAWTPDGQGLVFLRHREKEGAELSVISLKTGAIRSIRIFGGLVRARRVSMSPDGRYVAYDLPAAHPSSPRDIVVSAIDGSSHTVVAANPAADVMPLFTPDGSLLFLSSRGGSQGLWTVAMRDGKAQGAPRLLKPDVGQFYPLGLTRTGALYYFSGGDHINSYVQAVDDALAPTAEPVPVTDRFQNHNMSAAWSPDGRSLAFYAFQGLRENQGATLVVRGAASGDDREFPLTVKPNRAGSPARWFRDGGSVLVTGRNPDGDGNVFSRLDLATGLEEPLLTSAQVGSATYSALISADAKFVFHISPDSQLGTRTLRRLVVATGASTALLEQPYAIALSPEGGHLAYVASTEGANGKTVDIGIIPVAGGDRRILFTSSWTDAIRANALSWTPDGRHILFVRPEGTRATAVWRIPAAGGEVRKTGISVHGQITHPSLHPDGTRLVYTVRETSESSVWVLENFLPGFAARK
jgi:Tol biopolymer transport system component